MISKNINIIQFVINIFKKGRAAHAHHCMSLKRVFLENNKCFFSYVCIKSMCSMTGSNRRPVAHKTTALTTELMELVYKKVLI